mgnify:CR=1 FL=1
MLGYAKRKDGVDNDIAQFTHLSGTLLKRPGARRFVHGTHDNLLFYQAIHARDTIPNAKSIRVPESLHFCT